MTLPELLKKTVELDGRIRKIVREELEARFGAADASEKPRPPDG